MRPPLAAIVCLAFVTAAADAAGAPPEPACGEARIWPRSIPANGKLLAVGDWRLQGRPLRPSEVAGVGEVDRPAIGFPRNAWRVVAPAGDLRPGLYTAEGSYRHSSCAGVPIRKGPRDDEPPRWEGGLRLVEVRGPSNRNRGSCGLKLQCDGDFFLHLDAPIEDESPTLLEVAVERTDLDPAGAPVGTTVVRLRKKRSWAGFHDVPGARYRATITPLDIAGNRGERRQVEFITPGIPCAEEYGGGFGTGPLTADDPPTRSAEDSPLVPGEQILAVFVVGVLLLVPLLHRRREPEPPVPVARAAPGSPAPKASETRAARPLPRRRS